MSKSPGSSWTSTTQSASTSWGSGWRARPCSGPATGRCGRRSWAGPSGRARAARRSAGSRPASITAR
eukprot:3222680-Pyramimonas_sp.AAC.1